MCYVYKSNEHDIEFSGTLKEAVEDLLSAIEKFCSCDKRKATEIASGGYHQVLEEWDTFCKEHNQPTINKQGEWNHSFGDWDLFCMPAGTIGAVRGMFYWRSENVLNDDKLSLYLC